MTKRIRFITLSAVIAGMYTVLTYLAAAVNLAYGPVQFRFSEALTVLPALTPAAIPGLTVGCFLSNLMSPLGVVDWVSGTAATLLAALGTAATARLPHKNARLLAPLPPVIANAFIVGLEISCLSNAGGFSWANFSWAAFGPAALYVGIGELAVCYALGLPLLLALEKNTFLRRAMSGPAGE